MIMTAHIAVATGFAAAVGYFFWQNITVARRSKDV